MSEYTDVINYPEVWFPGMPAPESCGPIRVAEYQERIDRALGTRDGQPIVRLDWAPRVFKWRPHPLHEEPEGWTFPVFLALWDSSGREVAAPRWVLLERIEPHQYMDSWEEGRYATHEGQIYDAKGPAPERGYYIPLWRHIIHKDSCCLQPGNRQTCWGHYVEPNEGLFHRIIRAAYKARNDSDVKPMTPSRFFTSPKAQLEVKEQIHAVEKRNDAMLDEVFVEADRRRQKQTAYSLPEPSRIITLGG